MQIKKGFTLIELLVVIAIIGLISTLAVVGLNSARTKGRDAKRIADLTAIRTALELYFDDNDYYPPTPCGYDCGEWATSDNASEWSALAIELKPYLDPLPVDPINSDCADGAVVGTTCRVYGYANVGRYDHPPTYDLATLFETPNHPESCGEKPTGYTSGFNNAQWCVAHGGSNSNRIYVVYPN